MLWMILGEDRPGAAELRAQTRPAHLNHIAPLAEAGRVSVMETASYLHRNWVLDRVIGN